MSSYRDDRAVETWRFEYVNIGEALLGCKLYRRPRDVTRTDDVAGLVYADSLNVTDSTETSAII